MIIGDILAGLAFLLTGGAIVGVISMVVYVARGGK